jgi:hypothetical protein
MDTNKKPRDEEEIKKDEINESPPDADDTNRKSDEIRREKRESHK